jgi:hypothetical protein
MAKNVLRLGLTSGAVLAMIGAACAPGCGGTTSHKVTSHPDASAGEAGESGSAQAGKGGVSGGSGSGGVSPDAGAAGEAGATSGGSGGGAGEAGASGTDSNAGADGNPGTFTEVDAGVDCVPPTDTTRLSASALGLPADGLTLWVRADKGVYMTTDHHVCAWEDQSGHDTVLLAKSPGGRPTWAATGVGSRAAVTFPANDYGVSADGVLGIAPTSPRTFISVVQATDLNARFESLMQGQGNTPGTYIMTDANTFNKTGQFEAVYIMNNDYETNLQTALTPRVHVYTISNMTVGQPIFPTTGAPAIEYRVNGTKLTIGPQRNSGGLGNGNLEDFSGANFTLVGQGAGIVAEAMIYDRALTDDEKAKVESVLEARYGISP